MDKERGRIQIRRQITSLAVTVAVLVIVFTAGALWSRGRESAPVITNELLSQQLVAVSELTTLEYHYTNMGKFENQVDFYGWKVPLTKKSFIVAYDGVIRAGIDASAIEVDVRGKSVTVTLPQPEILSHEIDDDSLEIFDESQFIFNPLQISDYTGFTTDQRGKIEERALQNGLLDEAKDKAESAVAQLLGLAPSMEDYQLTVRTAEQKEQVTALPQTE